MAMKDIKWWLQSKWLITKLTINQMINVYVKKRSLTDKGLMFYDYCAKIIFDDYQPQTYQDAMFESDIAAEMAVNKCDRKTVAIYRGGFLSQYIKPSVFWSSDRPGKLILENKKNF